MSSLALSCLLLSGVDLRGIFEGALDGVALKFTSVPVSSESSASPSASASRLLRSEVDASSSDAVDKTVLNLDSARLPIFGGGDALWAVLVKGYVSLRGGEADEDGPARDEGGLEVDGASAHSADPDTNVAAAEDP